MSIRRTTRHETRGIVDATTLALDTGSFGRRG
jgi:hypothetical protein